LAEAVANRVDNFNSARQNFCRGKFFYGQNLLPLKFLNLRYIAMGRIASWVDNFYRKPKLGKQEGQVCRGDRSVGWVRGRRDGEV
jgi:hypothetical protein